MLILDAVVVNVFRAPEGVSREGEAYGGEYKVQLQNFNFLRNGEQRVDLVTFSTKNPEIFKDAIGDNVRVPVGAFVNGKAIQYYLASNNPEDIHVQKVG